MWIYTNVGRSRQILHLENGVRIALREAATSATYYISVYYTEKYFVDLAGSFEKDVAQACLDLIAVRLEAMDTAQRGLPKMGSVSPAPAAS